MQQVQPRVAAILNFLFWGSGYIYNRRRAYLGIVLLFVHYIIVGLITAMTFLRSFAALQVYALVFSAFATIFSLTLAWDANREAKLILKESQA